MIHRHRDFFPLVVRTFSVARKKSFFQNFDKEKDLDRFTSLFTITSTQMAFTAKYGDGSKKDDLGDWDSDSSAALRAAGFKSESFCFCLNRTCCVSVCVCMCVCV